MNHGCKRLQIHRLLIFLIFNIKQRSFCMNIIVLEGETTHNIAKMQGNVNAFR